MRAPERLSDRHLVSNFNSGRATLDDWLRQHAIASEGFSARTYVVAEDRLVAAYYCLAAGSTLRTELPTARLRRNMPDHVPVAVLGRLAVDTGFQGRGLGKGLVKDAILRMLGAADIIGMRALLVNALDEPAAAFYRRLAFTALPGDPRTLILPVETARKAL